MRLARLIELLTHTGDISNALRVPAVSRLQKLHNVGLVFKKFDGVKLAVGEGKNFTPIYLSAKNFTFERFYLVKKKQFLIFFSFSFFL